MTSVLPASSKVRQDCFSMREVPGTAGNKENVWLHMRNVLPICALCTCRCAGNMNLVPTDLRGLTFSRTPQQVRHKGRGRPDSSFLARNSANSTADGSCSTCVKAFSNMHQATLTQHSTALWTCTQGQETKSGVWAEHVCCCCCVL